MSFHRSLILILPLSLLPSGMYWITHMHLSAPVDGWFPGIFVDFRNVWIGGKLWLAEDFVTLTDKTSYNLFRQQYFPLDVGFIWSYPLHFLAFLVPLATLPFITAAFAWLSISYGVLFYALHRMGYWRLNALSLIFLSSGNFHNVFNGQNGALFSPLLWGAMLLARSRPISAGICLGFLSMKPQLLLFSGIFLLLTRSFAAIGVGVGVAAVLVAGTVLMIGIEPWRLLIFKNGPDQTAAMFQFTLQPYVTTWYAAVHNFTEERWPARLLQAVVTAAAVVLCVLVSISRRDRREKVDAVLVLTAFGLPYLLVYDLMLLSPVLLRVLLEGSTYRPGHRIAAIFVGFGGIASILLMITNLFPLIQVAMLFFTIFQMKHFFALPRSAYAEDETADRVAKIGHPA
jgi:hypothetical protein